MGPDVEHSSQNFCIDICFFAYFNLILFKMNFINKSFLKIYNQLCLQYMKNYIKDNLRISTQRQADESFQQKQQLFDDRPQIQQIRYTLKSLYFKKRKAMVDTLIEMLQQNRRPSQEAQKLKLPNDIQAQRESVYVINENFRRRELQKQQNNDQSYIVKQQPFTSIKQRIINKYLVKRQYSEQMKHRLAEEDSLQIQKRIIQDIYKKTLGDYNLFKGDNDSQQIQQSNYQNSHVSYNVNKKQPGKSIKLSQNAIPIINIHTNKHFNNQGIFSAKNTNSIQSPSNKKLKQSIVIQSKKNVNNLNYMRIDDPNAVFQTQSLQQIPKSNRNHLLLNQNGDEDKYSMEEELNKRVNISFQESGYKNFLNQQKKQLQQQKRRMKKLTEEANRALSNQNLNQSDDEGNKSHYFGSKNDITSNLQDSISLDQPTIQLNQVRYLFNQLMDLFILSQILKFQLHYRTYQILSKLYQEASKYYNQTLELLDPIDSSNFAIIIKPIISSQNQLRSEVDIIVNKIFQGRLQITFQQFNKQFQSILNGKQVKLFQPSQLRTQVDKTMQKTKRLFATWIQMDYFQKKIKQILRKKQFIANNILKQCVEHYDSQNLHGQLLSNFFSLNYTSSVQKLKIDIYFRQILGKDLKKVNFIQWYSNNSNQNYMFHSRYQRIGAKLNKDKNNG